VPPTVRQDVREQVNQALQGSADARDAHEQICTSSIGIGFQMPVPIWRSIFRSLSTSRRPRADAERRGRGHTSRRCGVENMLPLLRRFNELVNLHAIWLHVRPQYDKQLAQLHDSLTKMIDDTGIYLKTPAGAIGGRRFLVVIEPLLDPSQTNARVYGADYVVVASPVNGSIHMREVRHAYLHYQIEPLLYARATTLDRLLPFLKTVRDAPLDYTYRSDIVALVVECMIRAVEARTMDTGVTIYKIPADVRRSDLESATHQHNASVEAAEAVRRHAVQKDMAERLCAHGLLLYAFAAFEKQPQSFKESIGEMVYGMDVSAATEPGEEHCLQPAKSSDVVHRSPRELRGLDLAEMKLMKGDTDGAGELAQQSVTDKSGDPARANFILARVAIMHRDVPVPSTLRRDDPALQGSPHAGLVAHLPGRIYDIQDQRDQAVNEYRPHSPCATARRIPGWRRKRSKAAVRRTQTGAHRAAGRRGSGARPPVPLMPPASIVLSANRSLSLCNTVGERATRLMAQPAPNTLQAALGHTFREPQLLVKALTHSSLAYEQTLEGRQAEGANALREEDNEQLEFLGDAVLGLVVAEILFRRFPDLHEGEWTRLRASLVSRRHLAQVAAALDLGSYLRLGRGEERGGGRKKSTLLANCVEAIIAALYLDGGLVPVEAFVNEHVVAPYVNDLRQALDRGVSLGDHKTALQELLQAQKTGPPDYVLKAESGPDHRKRFLVEVRVAEGNAGPRRLRAA
jgi:ribonuclease III